ncbi:unnamed protein product [Calypogeia fissa]
MFFFDGQSFWLEYMHRAMKSLGHIKMLGESSAAAANAAQKEAAATEPESPQDGNGSLVERILAMQPTEKFVKKLAGPVRSPFFLCWYHYRPLHVDVINNCFNVNEIHWITSMLLDIVLNIMGC